LALPGFLYKKPKRRDFIMMKMKQMVENMTAVVNKYVNNERGAQALEWVALGLVVLAVMAAVATAVDGNGSSIANAIVEKISELIGRL
jgi:Flp pilus assembly pilin Flp